MCLSGANRPDAQFLENLLDHIAPIKRPRGRPRQRPAKLHADKAYDQRPCRAALHRRHITVRIARKGIESSKTLGRHRWVAERTLSWLSDFRRLDVRYERRDVGRRATARVIFVYDHKVMRLAYRRENRVFVQR